MNPADVPQTWERRDLPVLKTIVSIFIDTGDDVISIDDICQRAGMDEEEVQRSLRALYAQPYLQERGKFELGNGGYYTVGAPTGEALRLAGAWPTPEGLLDRLVVALERAAEDGDRDPEERGKLKQAALWLGGAFSQVAIGALGGAGGNIITG